MYEYLIFNQLKKCAKAGKSFHVPGHKAHGDFKSKFPIAYMDVTELSYSDNLSCPSGIIADAQKDIAEILGAKKSYIVTDGSSAGVLAMLYVAAKHGNKLIVPRNSHQSVWNACKLFGIEPVIVQGEYVHGVLLPPAPDQIEELLLNDVNISGMLVTNPDYYGNMAQLSEFSEILKRHSRLLIVDGAHGAHLAFEPKRKGYAGVYADMWVDGVHKCLPALTQGAVVSVNNESLIAELEDALSIFRTTSPSYPIMASVEYAIKYIKNNPKVLRDAKLAVTTFKSKSAAYTVYGSADWAKLLIDFKPTGISADLAAAALEKKKIYPELSDGRYILFYLSPLTTQNELNGLYSALNSVINNKKLKNTYLDRPPLTASSRTYSFQYALKNNSEAVPLEYAVGKMCARNAGVTPPCTPVVVAGELISEEAVKVLREAKNTFGLTNGKIWVVKK